jgi:hypothetical protein
VASDARTVTAVHPPVAARADERTAPAPVPAKRRTWSRWWPVAAVVAGFLLQLGWRLWLARSVTTPVAHADEDRYLLSARVLAGGPGGLGNDTEAFRRMGYPLLLAPIYRFTVNPWAVYHAAQALGAVVNALTFPLAYVFARRVLRVRSSWLALGLAFAAAALPAVVYYGEFALTDAVFPPLGLAWLLLLHGWLVGRTARARVLAAVGAGVAVGYMYTVHVRGAVLLAVHLAALGAVVLARRSRWKVALASAAVALAVTRLNWLAERLVGDRLATGGVEPQGRLWLRLTTAGGLVHTFCDAAGQLWYAGVGTWGLAAVGFVVAVDRVRGRFPGGMDRAQRVVLAAALTSTVLVALTSAAALPNDGRMSNHAYFRYIAFGAPVFVMLAGLALFRAGSRDARRLVARAAAGLAVGTFLVLSQLTEVGREWFHPFDTPEVSAMTASWQRMPVAEATAVALALLVVLASTLAGRRSRYAPALALAGVLGLGMGTVAAANAWSVGPMAAAEYRTAPRLVADLGIGPGDVVVSSKWVPLGARLNHQREVYWARVPEFDDRTAGPPAGATVVVAPWHSRDAGDWHGGALGWRMVAGDPAGGWAVWRRR